MFPFIYVDLNGTPLFMNQGAVSIEFTDHGDLGHPNMCSAMMRLKTLLAFDIEMRPTNQKE